ncbi:hypothetical protein HDE_01575 [Halotydeus destructor]|nr:hypothetical protein HDE_01575 [Halotydeus destructor]
MLILCSVYKMAEKALTLRSLVPFYVIWIFGYLIVADIIISIWTFCGFADTIPKEHTLGYIFTLILFVAILVLGLIGVKTRNYTLMVIHSLAMLCIIVKTYSDGKTKMAAFFDKPMFIYRVVNLVLGVHVTMYYRLSGEYVFEDALTATPEERSEFVVEMKAK